MSYSSEVQTDSPLAYWRMGDAGAVITAATASSTLSADTAPNAIDGRTGATHWSSNGPTGWLRLQCASAVALTSYAIRRRDDAPARNIRDWTFEGSTDGTTFTVLDTRTGITWPTMGEIKTFTFTNTTAYLYYRLNITANNGDSTASSVTDISTYVLRDASGNERHMMGFGGLTPAAGLPAGDSDGATVYNGTSGRAFLGSPGAWSAPTAVTVEAVVSTTNATGIRSMLDRDDDTNRAFQFRLNAGKFEFITINGAAGVKTAASPASIADGARHHIAATYDATNIKLYVDGALVTTLAAAGALSTSTAAPLGLGFHPNSSGAAFYSGTLDEVAYYGTALSDVRIAAHAAAASSPDTGVSLTGAAAPLTMAAPTGSVAIRTSAQVVGVAARIMLDAPSGVVSVASGVSVTLGGAPAQVALDAPAGAIQAGASAQLTGTVAPVMLNAPNGDLAIGKSLAGPTAMVRLDAPAGRVFAGTPPTVTEAVRVTPGTTGTTFTIPFTKAVALGDVVVVAYAGNRASFGDGRCGAHSISGLGGTWEVTPGSLGLGNELWWGVCKDATITGSATVKVDTNRDPLLIGLIIRGTNQAVEVVTANSASIVEDSSLGEVLVALAALTNPISSLDMLNYATRPTEAAWTETAKYAGIGLDKQLVYAEPRDAAQYILDPSATTNGYEMQWLRVGQAEVDVTATADSAKVTVKAPAGTVDAHIEFDPLNGAGTLTLAPGRLVDFVVMTETAITAGGDVSLTGDVLHAAVMTDVTLNGGGSLIARPRLDGKTDPRTGADQWRYVVTDLQGVTLGELTDIEHDPIEDGVNEPASMSFTMATGDPARALIKPIERQCQVWQGDQLRLRGPILPGNASDDGATITYTVHDPSWWWRDGRKRIGRVPKRNLLRNGDFTRGTTYWTGGFDRDSIPAAAPKVQVVNDDFTDGGKALQINGVESVTQTKAELQSSAVYWPNRPFVYEPLAAGFRPGGTDAVDAVAKAMPTTAGLKVTIVGHTANDGTGNGLELSLRRAKAAAARIKALRPNAAITTKGVGFYEPDKRYPVNSQQQRRVVISYDSTTIISGKSKQWMRQRVEVTQPKDARYSLDLVAAAHLKVTDDWSIEDANMVSVKILARRKDGKSQSKSAAEALASATDDYNKALADLKTARLDKATTKAELKSAQDAVVTAKAKLADAQAAAYEAPWDDQLGVGESSISDTDPVNRWLHPTAQATIPPDGKTYIVDVYLHAPAAQARYTRVVLEPQEALYYWGADQADVIKGLVQHMQDPMTMMGRTWPITVGTRTPRTGVTRDRIYMHSERMPIDTALEEFPSLNRGVDIDVLTTPTKTTVATFYPQQGQTVDYPLVLGGNIAKAVPASTRDVGSLVIAQAQDSSAARDEAYAADPRAFGGLMLQRLITAEQETPVNELDETARAELKWAKVSTPAYWLDVDPEAIAEVLAETGKGDTCRLILDGPDKVDALARIVKRQIHPDSLRLMVAVERD